MDSRENITIKLSTAVIIHAAKSGIVQIILSFQSRGGGTSLVTAVMEDEALAEQGEEASLLAGCRNLLRAVTKVRRGENRGINIHDLGKTEKRAEM